MKKMIRCLSACLIVCLLLSMMCTPALAFQSSKKYRTGLRNGAILSQGLMAGNIPIALTLGNSCKVGLPGTYKNVFRSEKVEVETFVQYAPNSSWTRVSETNGYSLTKSVTTSASAGIDVKILKSISLKASVSLSKGTSASTSIKPQKTSKYKYCRPCIRCDYVVITYDQIVYRKAGLKPVTTRKTMKIPLPGTMLLTYKYKN